MIKRICYMQYVSDWKRKHNITTQKKVDTIRNYLKFLKENGLNKESYSFDKYLEEFGYGGELYACYDEFLKTEYLDDSYMCNLLKREDLIAVYHEDINR